MMASTFEGLPKAVVRVSLDQGAHPDCLVGNTDEACQDCRIIVNDALGQTYGHLGGSNAVLSAILSDLLRERSESDG